MSGRKEPKINVISARFTNDELDRIKIKANELDMTHTAYIQMMACGSHKPHPSTVVAKVDPVRVLVLKELRQQGVNLNQIARGINIANLQGDIVNGYMKNLRQIREKITEIEKTLDQ